MKTIIKATISINTLLLFSLFASTFTPLPSFAISKQNHSKSVKNKSKSVQHKEAQSAKKPCCPSDKCSIKQVCKLVKEDLDIDKEILRIVNQYDGCVTVIESLPYIIETSGCYRLGCDLEFLPETPGQIALTIAASNVVLDLECHRVYQGNTTPFTTGIFINPNIANISIVGDNGTLQGFQGIGIHCPGPNDSPIGNIKLEGITVQECGTDFRVAPAPGLNAVIPIDGGIIFGPPVQQFNPVVQTPITEILISNILVLNNKNIGLATNGVTENIIIQNSIIDGTYSEAPSFYIVGLIIVGPNQADPIPHISNVQILNSTVSNTSCHSIATFLKTMAPVGTAGVFAQGIDNLTVIGSSFTQTSCAALNDNVNGDAGPFIGFCNNWLAGGIINAEFDNCIFSKVNGDRWCRSVQNYHTSANTSTTPPNPGLQVTKNHVYRNCSFSESTGSFFANGCAIFYVDNLVIENCISQNHHLRGDGPVSVGTNASAGFLIAGGTGFTGGDAEKQNNRGQSNQVVVKDCTVNNCTSELGQAVGYVYGSSPFYAFKSGYYSGIASQTPSTPPFATFTDTTASFLTVPAQPQLIGGTITFANGTQSIIAQVLSDTELLVIPTTSSTEVDSPYSIQYQSDIPTEPINLKNASFINCVAQNIITNGDAPNGSPNGPVLGYAAGILVDRGVTRLGGSLSGPRADTDPFGIIEFKPVETISNIFIENCRISNVHGAQTGLPLSGGIVMLGLGAPNLPGVTIIDSSISGCTENGILMSGGKFWLNNNIIIPDTTNSVVQANIADNNTFNGYQDTAGTNAFVNCTAFRNGATPVASTNFNIGASDNVNPVSLN